MTIHTVERTGEVLAESGLLSSELEIRWHAGEPLALSTAFYEESIARLGALLGNHVTVNHSLQTNGLLLNDSWMNLFERHGFRVGVSIDGPAHLHDAYRVTKGGRGTLAAVERRLGLFADHGVDFEVISVITPNTLKHVDEYLDYMAALSPRSLGVNVEESEGAHTSTALSDPGFLDRFRSFADALISWSERTGIPVREVGAVDLFLRSGVDAVGNTQNAPGAILTVTTDGEISTFSPELAGQDHPLTRSLAIGNVHDPDIVDKIRTCDEGEVADSVRAGVEMCRETCPYFAFCGGGAPVNKLYENGTFASTRTLHCTATIMTFAEAYLGRLEKRAADGQPA